MGNRALVTKRSFEVNTQAHGENRLFLGLLVCERKCASFSLIELYELIALNVSVAEWEYLFQIHEFFEIGRFEHQGNIIANHIRTPNIDSRSEIVRKDKWAHVIQAYLALEAF